MTRRIAEFRKEVSLGVFIAIVVCAISFAASNMGFKVIKPVVFDVGSSSIGDMWTSIPFFSYGNAGVLCTTLGLTSTGILRAGITIQDPITGNYSSANCGTSSADLLLLVPGRGVMIRQPNAAGAPTNL